MSFEACILKFTNSLEAQNNVKYSTSSGVMTELNCLLFCSHVVQPHVGWFLGSSWCCSFCCSSLIALWSSFHFGRRFEEEQRAFIQEQSVEFQNPLDRTYISLTSCNGKKSRSFKSSANPSSFLKKFILFIPPTYLDFVYMET